MMQPDMAPLSRRIRVSFRVSISAMATMPARRRNSGSSTSPRQLLDTAGRSRITSPAAKTFSLSWSSLLVAVLPMCG